MKAPFSPILGKREDHLRACAMAALLLSGSRLPAPPRGATTRTKLGLNELPRAQIYQRTTGNVISITGMGSR